MDFKLGFQCLRSVAVVVCLWAGVAAVSMAQAQPIQITSETKADETFQQMLNDGNALRHISKPYSGTSQKVGIGTVKLSFVLDASDTATAKEFLGKGSSSQSAQMKLVGVTPEMMQAIANDFHAALRAKLAEQGYEVVAQDKLLEDAGFKAAVASTKPLSTSFTGSVATVYAEGTGNIASFAMRNFSYYQKMPIVIADITLNFAAFDKSTNRWGGTLSASVTSKPVSSLGGHMMLMTEDGGGGKFDIIRPLILPSAIAASFEPMAKSGIDQAGSMVASFLGALSGQSAATAAYKVTAVANYQEVVSADMGLVAGVMANVLKKK